MNLSRRTLSDLAEIICGSGGGGGSQWTWNNFPYRSSMYLTEFFRNCDLEYVHDGSTRKQWVVEVLEELNSGPSSNPQLPSDALIRVAQELLDAGEFGKEGLNRTAALADLNGALSRDGLEIYLDAIGSPHVRSSGTGSSSAGLNLLRRSWTEDELRRRGVVRLPR